MRYRNLGSTDLNVSEIGFGTWGIGSDKGEGLSYGPQDDRTSMDALESAYQRGINFFDTSDLYGSGHSERLLGMVFNERRNEIIIATKVGFLNPYKQDFSIGRVRQAITDSLRRLKTDYIDLYQLHNPSLEILSRATDLFDLIHHYRQKGVIRAMGISARSPDEALEIVDKYPTDCVQVNMNLADMRAITNGLLNTCSRKKIGVIIRSPLALGFLSGKLSAETRFHAKDHRNRFSKQQMNHWSQAVSLYRSILNDIPDATDAQNALRFCLSHPVVSTVIPGMHTVPEVEENSHVGFMPYYDQQQLERILSVYRQHPFVMADKQIGQDKR